MIRPPQIRCLPIALNGSGHWDHIDDSFRNSDRVKRVQAWRSKPDPGFRPASVRTGWKDRSLFVYAVLQDDDIFNPVTKFNTPAFQHGDVFEIFLRPNGQEAYFEFHVNPNNQQFRLTIPSAEAFRVQREITGIPPSWFNTDPVLDSQVWVEPEQNRWRVLATLTLDQIAQVDGWLFSFSRYDYTRGAPAPVLSSSSPHPEIDFHRQQEWGRLRFEQ